MAIFGVVALHLLLLAGSPWGASTGLRGTLTWAALGNVIDIFFILSGFLIFLPMVRRGGVGDLGDYALGRLARVAPGYWLCLAVVFVLATWVPESPFVLPPGVDSVALNAAALQMPARMFDPFFAVGFGLDGPLWMISVIVGFYVVLPFIAASYLRRPVAWLVIAAAITVGWKLAAIHLGGVLAAISSGDVTHGNLAAISVDQLPGWAFSFALGMTGAWAYAHFSLARARAVVCSRWFVIAALGLYLASSYRYGQLAADVGAATAGSDTRLHPWLGIVSSGSRAALIAIVVVGPAWVRRPFEARPLRRFGELSYGVYLIHLVVAYYALRVLGLSQDGSLAAVAVWFAVVLPISMAYSQLSLMLVERPALAWARRRKRSRRKPIDADPVTGAA